MLSETTRAGETTGSVIYDVIQYDDVGYEMSDLSLSPAEIYIGNEEPTEENPDESTRSRAIEENGKQVISSSENIANLTDPANVTGADNILSENMRSSYLELVYDTEESNRMSSAGEISEREVECESLAKLSYSRIQNTVGYTSMIRQ